MAAEDRIRYGSVMEQVKLRQAQTDLFLNRPLTHVTVESAALQMTLALELVALSSIVTDRETVEEVTRAFEKKKPEKAIKIVRTANPDFWPQPTEQQNDFTSPVAEWAEISESYLTEDEWAPCWVLLNAWQHARNPFAAIPDPLEGVALIRTISERLARLLHHHRIQLMDRDRLLVCTMRERGTGSVRVFDVPPTANGDVRFPPVIAPTA
jgi:hypothetical protein